MPDDRKQLLVLIRFFFNDLNPDKLRLVLNASKWKKVLYQLYAHAEKIIVDIVNNVSRQFSKSLQTKIIDCPITNDVTGRMKQ